MTTNTERAELIRKLREAAEHLPFDGAVYVDQVAKLCKQAADLLESDGLTGEAQPAREWVSLTDDEVAKAWAVSDGEHNASASVKRRITRAIESKLREKNAGQPAADESCKCVDYADCDGKCCVKQPAADDKDCDDPVAYRCTVPEFWFPPPTKDDALRLVEIEREECAKLAETPVGEYKVVVACGGTPAGSVFPQYLDALGIAKAIRARGRHDCGNDCKHASDCAVRNAPAYPIGKCDCGAAPKPTTRRCPKPVGEICNQPECGCQS